MPGQPDDNFRPYNQSTPLRAGRGRGRGRNRRNNYHHGPMNHNRGSPRNNGDGRGYGRQNRTFPQDARFSNGHVNGHSNGSLNGSHNNSSVAEDSHEGDLFYEDSGCNSPYQVPRPEPEDVPLRDEDIDPYLDDTMLDDPWKEFEDQKEPNGSANGTTNGTTNGDHE
ncbi:hypothetical protein JYU34_016987 [Plutella xylostella]|uniref:Uncharacterized protein n=1 Tax=Plutella xylostella TaxID=51655 RepID=A0ABQ7Q445_PLUXY|nr:hypothetical protein JYU34_016987 [Plutella xylostella]